MTNRPAKGLDLPLALLTIDVRTFHEPVALTLESPDCAYFSKPSGAFQEARAVIEDGVT